MPQSRRMTNSGMDTMTANRKRGGRAPAAGETNAEIILRRRNRALDRQGYLSLALRVLGLAAVFWVLFTRVFLITQAVGNDMFPSVKDGDLVICFRLQRGYAKDDVVIYTADGREHIGRVAAVATDSVMLDESGSLLVNGTDQSGEILYPTYAKDGQAYPYRVPENAVFLLGDYRTQATDSRDYGAVMLSDVKGKVITILRRRGL